MSYLLLSIDDVIRIILEKEVELLPGENVRDLAFVALELAKGITRLQERTMSIEDIVLILGWICKFPIPGKPPEDRRTKQAVALLLKDAERIGEVPFIITQEIIEKRIVSVQDFYVRGRTLERLQVDTRGLPARSLYVHGRIVQAFSFRDVAKVLVR